MLLPWSGFWEVHMESTHLVLTGGADDSVFSRALISGHGLGFLVALLSWASHFTIKSSSWSKMSWFWKKCQPWSWQRLMGPYEWHPCQCLPEPPLFPWALWPAFQHILPSARPDSLGPKLSGSLPSEDSQSGTCTILFDISCWGKLKPQIFMQKYK